MNWIFLFILLFIAILLEATVTTLPLVFIVLFCGAVLYKKTEILIAACISGVILDILLLRTIGITSIFLLVTLALAFLYERKFEIQTLPFVIVFSCIGSILYLFMFVGDYVFLQTIVSCVLASGLFLIMQMFHNFFHRTVV